MHHRHPGDVSPWSGKAVYEPGSYGVAECDHHDRGRAGYVLGGLCGRGSAYDNDVRLAAQTFLSESRKPLSMALCGKIVDNNGLSVHITVVAQPLEKRFKSRLRRSRIKIKREEGKPRDVLGLLRARRERPHCRATKQRDEL